MEKYTRFQDIPKFTAPGRYAVDYPMDHLVKWIDELVQEDGLQLCPQFQRGHVWTEQQQQKYIEFLLRGGKTGRDLYFNYPSWHLPTKGTYNEFVCVDGLQRITAMQKFFGNKLKVFGSFFSEYTDTLRLATDTLRVHINDLQTEEEVLAWYLEMNSGGTPHSQSELLRVQKMLDTLKQKGD